MRHRSDIDDLDHLDSGVVDGTDGGLTAGAGTFHVALDLAETCVERGLGSILGCHLGGIGSVLLGSAESALAS